MAAYAYDDYRVTFVPRPDDGYDVTAVDASGVTWRGLFHVPLSESQLAGAVQSVGAHARSAPRRDIGGEPAPAPDAEGVGAALADALLAGPVGEGYAAARAAAGRIGHGVRLSLSLAAAPALLSVPWEFLYQRPRFLASQRKSPIVRLLATGVETEAVVIDSAVRILGVVASPSDLTPLDVAKERAGVETAVATMRELGRVELDWLEPATPKRLRETLRDGSYHVLHFIGHSAFTDAGDGVVFLEDDDGSSRAVDETLLANLLSDQDRLRLVVLNSCEGARTTISDPYAGVATTLVSLGVPAVVAMQFEISDAAAIVFATELYVNLIGRQAPIDAAIAEARKAVYSEVDPIEWATPVLFLRDPDVQLFDFAGGGAPLPLPDLPATSEHEVLAPPPAGRGSRRLRTALVVGAVVAAVGIGALVLALRDDTSGETGPSVPPASTTLGRRPFTDFYAVEVLEPDGEIHLLTVDPATGADGTATDRAGAHDTEPAWDRSTNRLAFRRAESSSSCTGLCYVVPGNNAGDAGKQVAQLVPPREGTVQHAPAWASPTEVVYAMTAGCDPGPGCAEEIRLATFEESADAAGFDDVLTPAGDAILLTGLDDVRDLAVDPGANAVLLAAGGDMAIVSDGGQRTVGASIRDVRAVAYTRDGGILVGLGTLDGRSTLEFFGPDGVSLQSLDIAQAAQTFTDSGNALGNLDLTSMTVLSITPGGEGSTLDVLLDDASDATAPVLATISIAPDGSAEITDGGSFPVAILAEGVPQAVAR